MSDLHNLASSLEIRVTDLNSISALLWEAIAEAEVPKGRPLVLEDDMHAGIIYLISNLIGVQRDLQKSVNAVYALAREEREAKSWAA